MAQKRRPEPHWLSRVVIDAIHTDQLREHGGLPGVRDENALESALARPRQKYTYGDNVDSASLAAAYAFGLVMNHPYRDGNKRIGFLAMATFIGLNDHDFTASDEDVVSVVIQLASGELTEEDVAAWIRARIKKA
jgi:death on curing protein